MKNIFSRVLLVFFFLILIFQNSGFLLSKGEPKISRYLGSFLKTGYVLQDKNEDGEIDYLNVRIVIPRVSEEAEITSAANISARLGFETMASDLDLIEFDDKKREFFDAPVILIGRNNRLLVYTDLDNSNSRTNLKPGQGEIYFFKKNRFFRQGGIVLMGYDATGLLAVSDYFAGRYPVVWRLNGDELEAVTDKLQKYFKQENIKIEKIQTERIVVENKVSGLIKILITVSLPDSSFFETAVRVFDKSEKKNESSEKKALKEKEEKDYLEKSDLEFEGIHCLVIVLEVPGDSRSFDLRPKNPWKFVEPPAQKKNSPPDFSLSKMYSIKGLFKDSDQDLVPDNTNAYVSMDGIDAPFGLVNFALRSGLETAGMRFPYVHIAGEEILTEKQGFPILFGIHHHQIKKILQNKKLFGISGDKDSGYIQFFRDENSKVNGLVISGKDKSGLEAISDYVSKRTPYLWDYGKGNYHLENIETDVRRFFQVRSSSGQAATAIYKLKTWLQRLKDKEKDIETLDIELALKDTPTGLKEHAEDISLRFYPEAQITSDVIKTGYGANKTIIKEEFTIPWEVDEFWNVFNKKVLPEITSSSHGKIFVCLSESPEMRTKIKEQIQVELLKKGVPKGAVEIVALCAYKQGYSWLHDYILPKIRAKKVDSIEIIYHTLRDSKEIRWQTVHANTRWLQEIFPIDSIFARELKIPDSKINFQGSITSEPIYTVRVFDKKKRLILEESFDPKYVIRPFFDLFPEYESLRVTTGWVNVVMDDRIIVDQRIKTDPEVFWDHLQKNTYRQILDYIMDIQEGKPSAANAPYFDEFKIELILSEPNYRLGLDEEAISSTEALHEDILFHTLAFFNRIGGRYDAGSLRYPGQILPFIRPTRDGQPGTARILFTGKEKAFPKLTLIYKEKQKDVYKQQYYISNLDIKPPIIRGIEVRSGESGLSRLLFEVEATDEKERYEEFKLRGTEESIDRSFVSVEKYRDMVEILKEFHELGIFEESLSYDRIRNLFFRFTLTEDKDFTFMSSLRQSSSPVRTHNPILLKKDYLYDGNRIVPWDSPLSPEKAADVLAALNTFPEVNAYYVASSFLGKNIFAADIIAPIESGYVSQSKLNALKPTLLLYGRVHGNEVSSTSHILRLAELCATDPEYKEYLKNVNLVLYPVVNPDGAQLAYEMFQENPDFMLHAGRYGALGTDVNSRVANQDSRYPEDGVVYRLRETWLPDIVIDMHGVPSHEWVQYFAGYSAWVNSRRGGARSYWLPRGWYIPGFSWIEDKKYPDLMKAQQAITDAVVSAITSQPAVEAMNKRVYNRYIKYGKQDMDTYREYFYKGIQFEARLKRSKINPALKGINSSHVTYYSIVTEAADETAYGKWLELVCSAGLAHSSALLRYLHNGENRIVREAKEIPGYVIRRCFRKKPVLPKDSKEEKTRKKKNL